MTGYEKIMSMSIDELAETGVCPHRFGLEDKDLCIKNKKSCCVECLKKALEEEWLWN